MRLKRPQRIRALEAWATAPGSPRCDLVFERLDCHRYVSCAGAAWEACEPDLGLSRLGVNLRGNCSTRLRDVVELESATHKP